jgi:glycosyltransferase involved in cell wall biosynthesis
MAKRLTHVLQIISSLEVGGSEKLLLDFLAACQNDDQINFTVVIMNQGIHPQMRERLERLGLNVYYLDRPEGHKHPKYWFKLLQIIRRHQVQILHAHNQGSKFWAMLCKLTMPWLKLVFTIHDTQMLPRLSNTQLTLHRHLINVHIAISKTVAGLCDQRGISNYRQIYNGIHLQPFKNSSRPNLQARCLSEPFSERPLHILHVGRMDCHVKGQDVLVQAMSLCKQAGLNVRCTLMGGVYPYNQAAFDALQNLVGKLNLSDEITYHLNQMDVAEQMAKADLFVLPSRAEGLGLVVLEAMASGLPVIASDTDGPRELVEQGVTGLLFASDHPEQLYEKIRQIYERPALADALRTAATDWVGQFDIQEMKRQYYSLYSALIDAPVLSEIKQLHAGRLTHETGV